MTIEEAIPKDLRQAEVSTQLEMTAAALCDLKVGLDRYARKRMGQPFLDDWMDTPGGNTCAYHGHTFLKLVLPFMDWEDEPRRKAFRAFVNPKHVLGASIKGLPEHVPDDQVAERIAGYRSHFGSLDHACYIRYRALGLYWAHEGKHRVAFMRAHEQTTIATWVREANYPEPERIVVIAPNDERDEWLAMLDGQHLQVLRRPRVSLRLLTDYGVRTSRWSEIPNLPNEQAVREAIYARKLHRNPKTLAERDRTLNLEEIRKQQKSASSLVDRGLHELAPLRLVWRHYLYTAAACIVAGLVLVKIPFDGLKPVGWMLQGTALGLSLALSLIRFRGPQQVELEPQRH